MSEQTPAGEVQPTIIKKYANRRLYNTATSRYVTLDDLCQMVKRGEDFVVNDAKSGADITRSVLTQIIVEEEAKGQNLLPIGFLRQLIGMYGDSMQFMVPTYLEQSMRAFQANQDHMRDYMNKAMGGMFPFSSMEELGKTNMAMLENAMRLFTPFAAKGTENGAAQNPNQNPNPNAVEGGSGGPSNADLDRLKDQIEALQAQLRGLADSDGPKSGS